MTGDSRLSRNNEGYDQKALEAASREVHLMFLREGSHWGIKACEEMGRVFMTAYRNALPSETKDRQTAIDAARYRWLRDDSLQWLLSGPICVRADRWGKPMLEYVGGNPEHGPSIHITLDGKKLDAEIDDAIARRNAVIEEVRAIVRGEKAMWEFIKRKGGGDDSGITACENIEDGLIALKTTSEQTNEAPQGTGESDRVKESAIPAGAAPFIERRKGERRIRIPTPDDKLYGGRLGTDRRKAK